MATTKVKLDSHKEKGVEYDIKHAEDLLKYQEEKGLSDWELSPNSGFKYENGTITPAGSGETKKSGGKGGSI